MQIAKLFTVCTAMLLASSIARADDFNPTNPPDPQGAFRITTEAIPAGAGYTSGTGMYHQGDRVRISTSSKDSDYRFVKWLKDGEEYSTSSYFYDTMPAANVVFTAVYEYVVFDPASPNDPALDYKWRLYLTPEPEEACSFNLGNGSRHNAEEWVTVTAYANQGFVFDGWYEEGEKISDVVSFYYEMPQGNSSLTARFHYDPESPDDPTSTLPPTPTVPGDVNGDNAVDSQDIVASLNAFMNAASYNTRFDVNNDGTIDSQDTIAIINYFLNSR